MKNLLLTFMFICGMMSLSAQYTSQIELYAFDINGLPLANECATVSHDYCGQIVSETVCSDPDGLMFFTVVSCDSIGTADFEFVCGTGTAPDLFTVPYNYNSPTVYTAQTTCYGANSTCLVTIYEEDNGGGDYSFIAEILSGGVAPFTYEWTLDGNVVPNVTGDVLTDNFSLGTHVVCVYVTDDFGQTCSSCRSFTAYNTMTTYVETWFQTPNGLSPGEVCGYIFNTSCNNNNTVPFCSDPNGYVNVPLQTCDSSGTVLAYINCPFSNDTFQYNLNYDIFGGNNPNLTVDCDSSAACYATISATDNGGGNYTFLGLATDGTAPYTYEWSIDGVFLPNVTGDNFSETFADGVYVICLTVVDVNGIVCDYCHTLQVNNNQCNFYVEIVDDTTPNGTILDAQVFNGDPNMPYSYSWSDGDTANPKLGMSGNSYCVTVTDDFGCTAEACITLPTLPNDYCEVYYTYTSDPITGTTVFNAAATSNDPNSWYGYYWSSNGNYLGQGETFTLANVQNGTYNICVEAVDSLQNVFCEYCEDVTFGNPDTCLVDFYYEYDNNNNIIGIEALFNGTVGLIYFWNIDGNPVNSTNGSYLDLSNYPSGTYTICVNGEDGNAIVCQGDCITVTLNGNNSFCEVYYTSSTDPSTGGTILNAQATGNNPNADYDYTWWNNGVVGYGETYDMSGFLDGQYYICVDAVDSLNNLACEYCGYVTINNDPDTCLIDFYYEYGNFNSVVGIEAGVTGNESAYNYTWWIDGIPQSVNSSYLDLNNYPAGNYSICVAVEGDTIEYCQDCTTVIIEPSIGCWIGYNEFTTPSGNLALEAWAQGSGSSYTFVWTLPDGTTATGNIVDLGGYTDGVYNICITATGDDGSVCDYCGDIYINNNNPGGVCLDWTVIDLANAPCTFDYDPVCGCDGVTYDNDCVAYYCFGITSWTPGECDYNNGGNGNGGNTGGTSPDTCSTTAEYFYYGTMLPNGGFEVFLFGYGVNADQHVWTLGDGTSAVGQDITHVYSINDSLQAYTICLTTITWADSCTATICETIVLDDTPNGFISGTIFDGGNLWNGGDDQVERGTGDNPMANVTIHILDARDNIIATTVTNANGEYSFANLQFGDYFVHVDIPGVNHEPYLVQLRPTLQAKPSLDFTVAAGQVTSGVLEVSFASDMHVIPNPTSGQATLSFMLHESTNLTVSITDIYGKNIHQFTNDYYQGNQNIDLDLSNLPQGIYMVSLQSDKEVYTHKVLKQ